MGEREEIMSLVSRVAQLEGAIPQILTGQDRISAEIRASEARTKADVEDKHAVNRKDIHDFRNELQRSAEFSYTQLKDLGDTFMKSLADLKSDVKENTKNLTNVRLKLAGLSLGSGVLTAIGVKAIDHFVK